MRAWDAFLEYFSAQVDSVPRRRPPSRECLFNRHIANFGGIPSTSRFAAEATDGSNFPISFALAGIQADCLLFIQIGTDIECFRANRILFEQF
jgi:hypothetical protein